MSFLGNLIANPMHAYVREILAEVEQEITALTLAAPASPEEATVNQAAIKTLTILHRVVGKVLLK